MTKPTGRPRGRPKTKEYVTLMARFPQDLADRVERYAGRKRQTVSDVLRDGALVLLQEDDDTYRPFTSDRNTAVDVMSGTKGEEEEEPSDVQAVIASDVKEVLPDNTSDMNAEIEPAADTAEEHAVIMSDTKEGSAYLVSDTKEDQPSIASDTKKARQRKKAKRGNVSDTNTDTGKVSDKKEDEPAILSDAKKVPAKKKQEKRPAQRAKRS